MRRCVYIARTYNGTDVTARYVRAMSRLGNLYRVFEVNEAHRTIREYDTDGEEIPMYVRVRALDVMDVSHDQVEWVS